MAVPSFTIRQLLEAGVHFGHAARRWNPKMQDYIYGERNKVHIINLEKTAPMLFQALSIVHEVASRGGRVLFVGTKRQAAEKIAESAEGCGQYFVNHRWLGGMLTNWKTISQSIRRLKSLENFTEEKREGLTKKELLQLDREREKLSLSLGGIKNMGGIPDLMFVIDTNKEKTAILEANKLGIPVIAVLDTNCDPEGIDYPIPGNDDALRAIALYCDLISDSILDGMKEQLQAAKEDVGASDEPPAEDLPAEEAKKEEKAADKDKKAKPKAKAKTESAKKTKKVEEKAEKADKTKGKAKAEPKKKAESKKESQSVEETTSEEKTETKAKKEAVA